MHRSARFGNVFVMGLAVSAMSAGCAVKQDDASRFREPIPEQSDVAMNVPGAKGSAGATHGQGLRIATFGGDGTARYYTFTRDLTNAIDGGTALILGGVWAIVHTDPTTLEAKRAVWGPGQATALEPVVWRFTVVEVGDAEYDYTLEGQPKTGGSWLTVLRGHGFGASRPEHKTGWFVADNDAYRTLDPARGHDYGTTKVTYDLTKLPETIAVELRPGGDEGQADVKLTHESGGAGEVGISALADLDDPGSKLEDIHLVSRWTTAGSGRADAELKGGDLPTTVDATECWSDTFARVYYQDTVDYEPTSGSEAACALTR